MWPFNRQKKDLPGVQRNIDGSIEFSITDDEQRAIDSFFRMLDGYSFHPEIADTMPKAGMACALCRYAIDIVMPHTSIETEAEYKTNKGALIEALNRATAATLKATTLYDLPEFTRHLAAFNDMAGRTAEAQRLKARYAQQQAEWQPSQLDTLLLQWLQQ